MLTSFLAVSAHHCRCVVVFAAVLMISGVLGAADAQVPVTVDQAEFFENRVRPVLVERCLGCHGQEKQQGGLRLDSRSAMLKGNESGTVLTPGKPIDSRLIRVLDYSDDDIQMPPAGKLPAEEIAVITRWVEFGAPWPADRDVPSATAERSSGELHWAFQPIADPPAPTVKNSDQVRSTVDAYVLAKLETAGLSLAAPADKATFIRRATLDLWGIPPTFADVQDFLDDTAHDAVPRLIDRLLDSPLYGQRWARHWLDVARYADTKGYVFTEEPRFPYAYTYRDYVVDSFNSDKPYDRFILEQIAADQLEISDDQSELAALGFLTVGRRFLNKQEDIIDDRIDVVTRGLMSLTVGCARCHDHKYDPIPTADYYSLFGVFISSQEPGELPIIGSPKSRQAFEAFQKELAEREKALAEFEQKTLAGINAKARSETASYLTLIVEPKAGSPTDALKSLVTGEPRPKILERWKNFLSTRKDPQDKIFGPWNQLISKSAEEFPAAAAEWLTNAATEGEASGNVHALVRQALVERKPTSKVELAQAYGRLFADIDAQWQKLKSTQADASALPDAAAEELRQVLFAEGAPTNLSLEESKSVYLRDERNKQRELIRKIENLKATSSGAPPRAMVMRDKDKPVEPRILIRGNPGRPGEIVPRRFLEVVAGKERPAFQKGSGRLELAQGIVSPQNPLTARVIVNRIWQHHFGEGLVRTPGDFGIRGEAPTHPELLDHLATRFMQNGWSLKMLHRWIMSSATYAQSSVDRPHARTIDPENRLLWKMPRQRLELEALRDSWLAVSGRLDTSLGGRPFDNIADPASQRRTLYGFINRNDLPGVFRAFDFADVDVSMAERPETTVPQQALFAMNSPFVIEQAKHLAASVAPAADDGARVTELFRRALSRDPESAEREFALRFVQDAPHAGKLTNWDKLAHALLLTNEFVFVD